MRFLALACLLSVVTPVATGTDFETYVEIQRLYEAKVPKEWRGASVAIGEDPSAGLGGFYGFFFAVGAPAATNERGKVLIYRGLVGENGLPEFDVYQVLTPGVGQLKKDEGQFGFSVATMGTTIFVGAPFENGGGLADRGTVYVYEYSPVTMKWHLKLPKLVASNPSAFANFGYSLDVEDDVLVVGAPYADSPSAANGGGVYVFRRQPDGTLVEVRQLYPKDGLPWIAFGHSAAIDDDVDGRYVVVAGAPLSDAAGPDSGAAYVFTLDPVNLGDALDELRILDPTPTIFELFGTSVDVLANPGDPPPGDPANPRLVVGAPQDTVLFPQDGSVNVYERDRFDPKGLWLHEVQLFGAPPCANNDDAFGTSVAIVPRVGAVTDFVVLAGVPLADSCSDLNEADKGRVDHFTRTPVTYQWYQKASYFGSHSTAFDRFGQAIAGEGGDLLIGAPREGPLEGGAAYYFRFYGIE